MVIGTGIDIVEIERIQKAIDRWGANFLHHVFTEEEIRYAQDNKSPAQHYAARFAAKEAVFKAIGNNPQIGWKDISVFNDKFGKPCCSFKDKNFKDTIHLSISHSKNYAIASVIITSR